ncbi:MAG: CotH kinase family protein, partial [Proteobacteria bacterium]|nr:CotH kinase family protein [Pseudomonadota bacterium]
AFNPESTKTILSLVSGGVTSTKVAINKNYFYEQTLLALVQQMKAERRKVAIDLIKGTSQTIAQYPLAAAIHDLQRYHFAGRIEGAIAGIQKDAAIKEEHYVGVYLLIEKIKRGKNRVDIRSLKPTSPSVTGEEEQEKSSAITGGYILKIDKMDRYETYFYTRYGTRLFHVYPKGREISNAQKAWIQNYMNEFEAALAGTDFKDPEHGYATYIDIDSFIDHFIINELFKNTDGFRNSTYMYKDRDGKLEMGPVWDFNLSMGNSVFYNAWETSNWLIDTNPVPFWWDRLLTDEDFKQRLVKRWKALRKNELATSKLLGEIDRTADYLSEAQKRNFERWPVLGRQVFGNPGPYLPTYEQEVQQLKTWLQARLEWMDQHIKSPRQP